MTLTIVTSDGIYSNSSYQKVEWKKNIRIKGLEGETWNTNVVGEAPHVLLPNSIIIISTIENLSSYGTARYLINESRGNEVSIHAIPNQDELLKVQESKDLKHIIEAPSRVWPSIIAFNDLNDINSGYIVLSDDGDLRKDKIISASLVIEKIQQTALTFKINSILPWLDKIDSNKIIQIKNGNENEQQIRLYRDNFISY